MKLFEILLEDQEPVQFKSYVIRPGDTMSKLARANDTTVDGLMYLNPQVKNANVIIAGQKLRLPDYGDSDSSEPAKIDTKSEVPAPAPGRQADKKSDGGSPAPAPAPSPKAGGKTSAEFDAKLKQIADRLGLKYEDLYKIIQTETAGSFSPSSHDPNNVSVGLIGFTEPTARSLGTSKAQLAQMSALDQLDYVEKFYKMIKARPGDDRGTLYMRTFLPAFANSPDDTVLGQKGGGTLMLPNGKPSKLSMDKIYWQNPAFGVSQKRDSFTVGDVKRYIYSR